MMEGWKKVKLADVCEIRRGASPRPILEYLCSDGIPWVKISDATNSGSRFIDSTVEFIKPSGRNASVTVYPGDLILSNSATPGIPRFLNIEACIHDGWLLLRDFKDTSKEFLFYVLTQIRNELINQTTGSVFNNLKTEIVKEFEIDLPPLPLQRRIAEILGALDDKIDLNRQMNHTLEQMAQALYKHFFVDGIDPENLPEGWRNSELGKVTDISIGRTPPRAEKQWFSTLTGDYKWISIKDIGDSNAFIFNTSEFLTRQAVEKFNIPTIPENTVIVSFKLTVGRVTITTEVMLSNEAIAHCKITDTNITLEYLYLFLKTFDYGTLGNTSSIATAINSKVIKNIHVLVPSDTIINEFSLPICPIFSQIKSNMKEIICLQELRDIILPRLISGEIIPSDLQTIEQAL